MMANCLRMPMASSLCRSPSSSPAPSYKRRSVCAINSSKIPMPPLNPKDPSLSKLASDAATSPDTLPNRPKDSDKPPPVLMSTIEEVERSVASNGRGYRSRRSRPTPPDLASAIFADRVVFIGMPLVPLVTELIVAELLYLLMVEPELPIQLHINSIGTTRDDGTVLALESQALAIYDVMMQSKTKIYTVCVGLAVGQACLLLAAGAKGKRFMIPHSTAMIQQPRLPPSGLMPSSDVLINAKEAIINRDTFVKLLAMHTGNSEETVASVMKKGPFYMTPTRAIEFGVADQILTPERIRDRAR